MSENIYESSRIKLVPFVQSEGVFNAGIILIQSNYDVWFQLMKMHIAERRKLSYIHGKTKLESEDGYEKWYAENQKFKRWLLMFMTQDIIKRYLCWNYKLRFIFTCLNYFMVHEFKFLRSIFIGCLKSFNFSMRIYYVRCS